MTAKRSSESELVAITSKEVTSPSPTNRGLLCIIHYERRDNETEVRPLSEDSFMTIRKTISFREKLPLDNKVARLDLICKGVPRVFDTNIHGAHRWCYQNFTNTSKLRSKFPVDPGDSEGGPPTKRLKRCDSVGILFPQDQCLFCSKKRKKMNGFDEEQLIKCCTLTSQKSIQDAAKVKKDPILLLKVSNQDLIAKEAMYHSSCRREYTRKVRPADQLADTPKNNVLNLKSHEDAFTYICEHVEHFIIQRSNVQRMTMLREIYLCFIQERYPSIYNSNYKTDKLKAKLINYFGSRIEFWKPNYRSELVYSSEVPKGSAVEQVFEIGTSEESRLDEAALIVNRAIKDTRNKSEPMVWPPTKHFLLSGSIAPPIILNRFLSVVITGKLQDDITEKNKRIVNSTAQDICYAVSNGEWKMPKHLALGMSVRHLTGSKQVITLLNRFGHSVSNTTLLELETAMCTSIINQESLLPPTINPNNNSVLHLCWDNFDLNEETPSGTGTTHSTHGIILQETLEDLPYIRNINAVAKSKSTKLVLNDELLEPCFIKDKVEHTINASIVKATYPCLVDYAYKRDITWILARAFPQGDKQNIPGWAGWLSLTEDYNNARLTTVDYMAPINLPVTDNATVIKLLRRSQQVTKEVGQEYTIVTFDLAVAKKAFTILWQRSEFKDVIVRLGVFHTTCAYLAALGKRCTGSGFEDILTESMICVSGSIDKVMKGRHYNRAIRVHKLMIESLERMLLIEFEEELKIKDSNLSQVVRDAFAAIAENPNPDTLRTTLENINVIKFYTLYEEFKGKTRSGELGKTAQFWIDYVDKVWLLLRFLSATKLNKWDLHLTCLQEMLPMFFSYDHQNYARFGTVYLLQSLNLDESHPGAQELMKKNGFSAKRSSTTSSRNAVDLTIEQTINRHAKSRKGQGIVGFSRNFSAYHRWCTSRHARTSYLEAAFEMADIENNEDSAQNDLRPSQIITSDEHVQQVINAFEGFINPFKTNDKESLFCLSSGAPATKEVEKDLFDANKIGTECYQSFVNECFVHKSKSIHAPIKRNKLKTFAVMGKKIKMSGIQKKVITLKAERNMFGQLVLLSEEHNICMKKLLTFALSPIPWSLATPDGLPVKSEKAKLMHELEKDCVTLMLPSPDSTITIIDGNALIQSLVGLPDTFKDLSKMVFNSLPKSTEVHFVTDSYHKNSIKSAERERRGTSKPFLIKGSLTRLPRDWKTFLSNSENKTQLIQLMLNEWTTESYAQPLQNRRLFYVSGESCTLLTSPDGNTVSKTSIKELQSLQEEADSRMMLHCWHAASRYDSSFSIIVRSPDTDVFILLLKYAQRVNQLVLLDTGFGDKRRLIDINKVISKRGAKLCEVLAPFHAFTGCDTTSSFVRRGKLSPLKLLEKYPEFEDTFLLLGNSINVEESTCSQLEKFVCLMYGETSTTDVNETRYRLFRKRFQTSLSKPLTNYSGTDLSLLPPCKSSLRLHILRANYQAMIWCKATDAMPDIPEPSGHGWSVTPDGLIYAWTEGNVLPNELINILENQDDGSDAEDDPDDIEMGRDLVESDDEDGLDY